MTRAGGSVAKRLASATAFWMLAVAAVALFALAVLAAPLAERREMRYRLAVEEAKVRQLEDFLSGLELTREALERNPRYVARQIREDLGYYRPGEHPLPEAVRAIGPRLKPLEIAVAPETRLEQVASWFNQPGLRGVSIGASLMMLAMAFLFFDIPTVARSRKDGDEETPGGQ